MKKIKILVLLIIVTICNNYEVKAQANMSLNYFLQQRIQQLNQYTDVFVSAPTDGLIIDNIFDDSNQSSYANSNKYYEYNQSSGLYVEIDSTTVMTPGVGYVLQIGGNGDYTEAARDGRIQNFSGGSLNSSTVTASIINNKFGLFGNPYMDFLDLDSFLLYSSNVSKVKGPVYLWSHNTLVSSANREDNQDEQYAFSSNDFALYNVLGGVAAGRSISTSDENETYTGVQTPNGRLCFGTGFAVKGIGTGNVTFTTGMSTTNNGGEIQSFRNANVTTENNNESVKDLSKGGSSTSIITPPVRNRIWVNIENGTPPSSGTNLNQLKQLLVGYAECYGTDCATTADNDRVFDAETFIVSPSPKIEFYSLAPAATFSTKHLAIQGRDAETFSVEDYFQLGYSVTEVDSTTYTFTAVGDGIFDGSSHSQRYYISDNDVVHEFPYTTTIAAGSNATRFKIVFGIRLKLHVCIAGYYDHDLTMFPVKYNQGTSASMSEVCDLVVELRDATDYTYVTQSVSPLVLDTGCIVAPFFNIANGNYYLAIKHRNTIETWSANAIDLGAIDVYDFTTAASQAYGSNQTLVDTISGPTPIPVYAIYSGDVDQDDNIDLTDYSLWQTAYFNFTFGDSVFDLNGDGIVDGSDYAIWQFGYFNSPWSLHP